MIIYTPNRKICVGSSSPILEKSLLLNQNKRSLRNSFIWGTINSLFLFVLLYDVSYMCPLYVGFYLYLEYGLISILTFNVLYYVFKLLKITFERPDPMLITQEQKKLLGVQDTDPNFKIVESPLRSPCTTPMDTSAVSWRSTYSPNDSMNYSLSSSWTYVKGTPDTSMHSPLRSSYQETGEFITDEHSLNKYLQEYGEMEKNERATGRIQPTSNLLSSFWSHPVTKSAKDMTSFLKKCQYQLSTLTPVKTSSPISKEDKTTSPGQITALEVWTRINVDSVALTQWNENLRKWLSQTILERLVNEFDRINTSLEKHGLTDVKVGSVGLERLRKTAHMVPVVQFIPSLATLLSFLEVTTNQEYLVKRIRELAKGGCMSEFKWNGGSSYNGRDWDDSLPTDCAIIMHLLACYLDTQLMPLPSMPDTKAFSGHHYIKVTDKMPTLTPGSLFIQEVSEKPPNYRVIVGEKVYEMVKGYNNLFHSILFFIYHVNKMEHGMLGRVNLGRAGINILWVIDK